MRDPHPGTARGSPGREHDDLEDDVDDEGRPGRGGFTTGGSSTLDRSDDMAIAVDGVVVRLVADPESAEPDS